VALALHRVDVPLIECGAMHVCRPKPPENIAIM
jgi:hypothetical protein